MPRVPARPAIDMESLAPKSPRNHKDNQSPFEGFAFFRDPFGKSSFGGFNMGTIYGDVLVEGTLCCNQ